ncbi:hypothetical protein GZ77_03140, partial [Endozoicomonas montiporae]
MKSTFRSLLLFLAIACFGVTAYSEQFVETSAVVSYEVQKVYPDWENPQDRLPYAMMSYFAEVAKIQDSKNQKPKKYSAIKERFDYLAANGYVNAEKEDLPQKWFKYFQGGDLKRIYNEESGFRARIFINDVKKTVVLAIAG